MRTTGRLVSVKFLGFLPRLTGTREVRVEVAEGTTVAGLLGTLAASYGPQFAAAIFRAPGEVHTHLRVFLDEAEAAMTDCLSSDSIDPAVVRVLVVPGFEGGRR